MSIATDLASSGRPGPVGHPGQSVLREDLLEVPGTFALHHGGQLPGVRVAWRLAGVQHGPVIAVLGGISAGREVFDPARSGWWESLVGPDRAIDACRYRILGIDYLGGSGSSTGPRAGQSSFPCISSYDQAELLARLLTHLGLDTLHAIVGASYGGMVGLAFAERYPRRVEQLIVLSAAATTHPMATAWRSIERRVVRYALERGDGAGGLEIARALAMATYRSASEFAARFDAAPAIDPASGARFPVEQYLFARGAAYADHYRAESFICLSESIDLHRVDPYRITTPATLIAIHEDQLVPVADMRRLAAQLAGPADLIELDSIYGHDAFLKESRRLTPIFTRTLNRDGARDE
jgi:homoserine O-acetyltransferase